MIDNAALEKPNLIVLPEFINHSSWYKDKAHNFSVAVDINGSFLSKIADKARQHNMYIVVNCTVKRDSNKVTGTNLMYDPGGSLVAQSDKQVLMGNENNFLEPAVSLGPVVDTQIGRVGMFSCMDGVMYETPRCISLRNAQIMCNTLNSFANDEASLHIPVRAAENKVFVIAANKSGPLVPEEARNAVAEKLKINPDQLNGAGESQIVDPLGNILAKAPVDGEHIITAEINIELANNKHRPDNTNIFSARRPELYTPISMPPQSRNRTTQIDELKVATLQPKKDQTNSEIKTEILKNITTASENGVELIVLPELSQFNSSNIDNNIEQAVTDSKDFVFNISKNLKHSQCKVVTSIVSKLKTDEYAHAGVLIDKTGIILQQNQLHNCGRHTWANNLGQQIHTIDLQWGRLGIITGGDSIFPEIFRLFALQDVDALAVTTKIIEKWEFDFGLKERAAENRISLIVGSFASDIASSLIIAPDKDFTLWTEWERPFDGSINEPKTIIANKEKSLTYGTINPSAANNRIVTLKTDVVSNRPWTLLEPLTKLKN